MSEGETFLTIILPALTIILDSHHLTTVRPANISRLLREVSKQKRALLYVWVSVLNGIIRLDVITDSWVVAHNQHRNR